MSIWSRRPSVETASHTAALDPPMAARQAWQELPTLTPRSLALSPVAGSRGFSRDLVSRAAPPTVLRAPADHPALTGAHTGRVLGLAAVSARAAVTVPAAVEVGRPLLRRWFRRRSPGIGDMTADVPEISRAEVLSRTESVSGTAMSHSGAARALPSSAPAAAVDRAVIPATGRPAAIRTASAPTRPVARSSIVENAPPAAGSIARAAAQEPAAVSADGIQRTAATPVRAPAPPSPPTTTDVARATTRRTLPPTARSALPSPALPSPSPSPAPALSPAPAVLSRQSVVPSKAAATGTGPARSAVPRAPVTSADVHRATPASSTPAGTPAAPTGTAAAVRRTATTPGTRSLAKAPSHPGQIGRDPRVAPVSSGSRVSPLRTPATALPAGSSLPRPDAGRNSAASDVARSALPSPVVAPAPPAGRPSGSSEVYRVPAVPQPAGPAVARITGIPAPPSADATTRATGLLGRVIRRARSISTAVPDGVAEAQRQPFPRRTTAPPVTAASVSTAPGPHASLRSALPPTALMPTAPMSTAPLQAAPMHAARTPGAQRGAASPEVHLSATAPAASSPSTVARWGVEAASSVPGGTIPAVPRHVPGLGRPVARSAGGGMVPAGAPSASRSSSPTATRAHLARTPNTDAAGPGIAAAMSALPTAGATGLARTAGPPAEDPADPSPAVRRSAVGRVGRPAPGLGRPTDIPLGAVTRIELPRLPDRRPARAELDLAAAVATPRSGRAVSSGRTIEPPLAGTAARLPDPVSRPPAEVGSTVTRWESPGDAAVASGVAMRATDGTVVFPSPRTGPASDGVQPVVRRVDSGTTGPTESSAPASPGAAHHEGVSTATDLAAMEDALYERIEYRLRTDLMLERERTGSLPDSWAADR